MESETLHMTIGDEMGLRIMEIAMEHTQYNFNPEKGLKVILDSLIGCPREIALKILTGDMVLPVDVESQQVICCDREDYHEPLFPKFNPREWADKKLSEIINYINKPKGANYNFDLFDWINQITAKYNETNRISIDFTKGALVNFSITEDEKYLIDELKHSDEYNELTYPFIIMSKFLIKSFEIVRTIEILEKWYPNEFEGFKLNVRDLIDLKTALDHAIRIIDVTKYKSEIKIVDEYLSATKEIDEVIKEGIKPVKILDGYNAGWLSPKGVYYALNGQIANMLHNQIADALYEAKIIPNNDDSKSNPDGWLERHGWVKIHNNWILYDGYNNHRLSKKDISLTKAQIKSIYEYGSLVHGGALKFGYTMTIITTARFQMMSDDDFRKLFGF